ncbi:MAG: aminoacyl-tRNA hydrolase [Oscillospiraceae bacterium]|nr:aminoacyl-tRNA hydrolase [Oscillospiraceae bacterium]
MYLITGLGNIGKEYENTRHNAGFMVIDHYAGVKGISMKNKKFNGSYGECRIGDEKVIILKPLTFMNLSGESIVKFVDYYNIELDKILIICDDVNLPLGTLRIKRKGSAGGHNGLKNIILNLATFEFSRLKLGVGTGTRDLISHVLGKFNEEEMTMMKKSIELSCEAIDCFINEGIDHAMNRFNGIN